MDITAIALSGMEAAQQNVPKVAKRIASPEQSGDTVDLSTEMVSLLDAKNQFAANAQVMKTAQEMEKRTLDLSA
jgi:flagellar basal body rod protein FlgC